MSTLDELDGKARGQGSKWSSGWLPGPSRLFRWGTIVGLTKATLRLAQRDPVTFLGLLLVAVTLIFVIFGPFISPYPPLETHYDDILRKPGYPFLLGTDSFGRDVFSRLVSGARTAIFLAVIPVIVGSLIGAVIGMVSAYAGGWTDLFVQRVMDGFVAIPTLILALALVAVLGRSDSNVAIAIAALNVPVANRVVRSVTLSIREEPYVEAARAIGASPRRIMAYHIGPNSIPPLLVLVTNQISWAIIVAASLSFLGLGSPPPSPTWGGMLSEGMREYATRAPWLAIAPAVFMFVAILGFTIVGDAARDHLDPRMTEKGRSSGEA